MGNKIQRIYIGTEQVRPIKKVECDFTQSDYGFVFATRTSSRPSYGRNSGGLYMSQSGNYQEGVAWKIPSSIYGLGTLKKLELVIKRDGGTRLGGGIATGVDTKTFRFLWDGIGAYWGNTVTETLTAGTTAGVDYTLTIDVANSEVYMTNSSTKLTLPSVDITSFNTDRVAGNTNISVFLHGASTAYIKKATFEIYG